MKMKKASQYLKGLLTEKDIPLLLENLRGLVEGLGGFGKLARATGLSRTSLYKSLNGETRPNIDTLLKILDFAGYELALDKKSTAKRGLGHQPGRGSTV